jgi:hypothetical protein
VIREYIRDMGIPSVNDVFEEVFGRYAIGRYPSIPEMRFFIHDLAAFTPELIHRLRARLRRGDSGWGITEDRGGDS